MSDKAAQVKVVPDFRVPLKDGRHLSARLWLPEHALDNPVPALIEYAPFRHYDFSFPSDEKTHPWFAAHGYASIRLDPAGSMNSGGMPMDEYVQREQDDCLQALDWISKQPWCTGKTGMFGLSWSAISALQVAALRPPSLKAIIPVHGTDDRSRDDIHYKGGCLLTDGLAWGAIYQCYMLRPPHPDLDSEWRSTWLQRLESAPDILDTWLRHHANDSYWQHASVSGNYSSIEAATYLVGGWADGYSNASLRLAEHLQCPKKLLIGPWGHAFPHLARPGPQIGFLQEAKRWWDRWLKNIANGVEVEDGITLYLQDSQAPEADQGNRSGKWISFPAWPSGLIEKGEYFLAAGKLSKDKLPKINLAINSPLANGMPAGEWLVHGIGPEMPDDQALEDEGSLCFDSDALSEPLNLCGSPEVQLRVKTKSKQSEILVRLNDVRPDGSVALITYGLLSLEIAANQQSRESSGLDSSSNESTTVTITLDAIAQRVPVGHQLRLAISNRAWPMIWPSADTSELEVSTTGSKLTIPLLDSKKMSISERLFEPPAESPTTGVIWSRKPERKRNVSTGSQAREITRTFRKDNGCYVISESSTSVDASGTSRFSSMGEDPLSAKACFENNLTIEQGTEKRKENGKGNQTGTGDWKVDLKSKIVVTADHSHFYVNGMTTALEQGAVVFERPIKLSVPRPVPRSLPRK